MESTVSGGRYRNVVRCGWTWNRPGMVDKGMHEQPIGILEQTS